MKKCITLLAIILIAYTGVSAQTIDSVRIDSISISGLNPQNAIRLHVHYYGVTQNSFFRINYGILNVNDSSTLTPQGVAPGTDTTSVVLSGLAPGSTYQCKVLFFYPTVVESPIKTFTTATCSFNATVMDSTISPCKTRLLASPQGAYTYKWKKNGSFIAGATLSYYDATASGLYNAVVSNGTCSAISAAVPVLLTGIELTTSGDVSFCKGESSEINASGATTYVWSPVAGLSNATISNPVASPNATTTYTVTGTTNGCTASATVKVVVNSLPSVAMSVSEDSICKSAIQNIFLYGTPVGGTFSGLGVSGNIFIPGNAAVGANFITYTYANIGGCENSTTVPIYVLDTPAVDSIIPGGNMLVVYGNFQYPIQISSGGVIHYATAQNAFQAVFNMAIKIGDFILVQSTAGGCFITWTYNYGLGVDENIAPTRINSDKRIFDVLGREVKYPQPNTIYIQGGKKFLFTRN
jgi:hypothetical protein